LLDEAAIEEGVQRLSAALRQIQEGTPTRQPASA